MQNIGITGLNSLLTKGNSFERYRLTRSGFANPFVVYIEDGRFVGIVDLVYEMHQTRFRMNDLGLSTYNVPLKPHLDMMTAIQQSRPPMNLVCEMTKNGGVTYKTFTESKL
jgi:hypothetical protein